MLTSTISETKNHLSRLLAKVRKGESLLILDRKRPVARIEPVSESEAHPGLAGPILHWDPEAVLALPIGEPALEGASLSAAVMEEREEGW